MPKSAYLENKTIDWLRGQTFLSPPTNTYLGLLVATRGYANLVRQSMVFMGDTVIPTTPNGSVYLCTTQGVCGGTEPAWNTAPGSTTADGAAVWTEQTNAIKSGTVVEVNFTGTNYSRLAIPSNMTVWSGTQGLGTTGASVGTSGQTSNNFQLTMALPIGSQWGLCWASCLWDSATGGNLLYWGPLDNPQYVNASSIAPIISAAALRITEN
jgi:hypothetical protein